MTKWMTAVAISLAMAAMCMAVGDTKVASAVLPANSYVDPENDAYKYLILEDPADPKNKGGVYGDSGLGERGANGYWTRKTQIPVILRNDGSIPAVQDSGLFEGVSPVVGEDGVTITLKPAFLDKIPNNFTTGAGQALGHSDKGKIQIAWLGGNSIVTGPDTIRMIFDRRRTTYS